MGFPYGTCTSNIPPSCRSVTPPSPCHDNHKMTSPRDGLAWSSIFRTRVVIACLSQQPLFIHPATPSVFPSAHLCPQEKHPPTSPPKPTSPARPSTPTTPEANRHRLCGASLAPASRAGQYTQGPGTPYQCAWRSTLTGRARHRLCGASAALRLPIPPSFRLGLDWWSSLDARRPSPILDGPVAPATFGKSAISASSTGNSGCCVSAPYHCLPGSGFKRHV
jgi:hypothetical protein